MCKRNRKDNYNDYSSRLSGRIKIKVIIGKHNCYTLCNLISFIMMCFKHLQGTVLTGDKSLLIRKLDNIFYPQSQLMTI